MDCLMGVDLGSTRLKAVIYDLDGRAVAAASRPTLKFPGSDDHPEWVVWRPEQIWEGAAAAMREAVEALGRQGTIRGLAVTGMGMDGLPVDEQGTPLYPFISWHDSRTQPQHRWWLEQIGAPRVFAIGGNPLWPINSALRMQWLAENEPELYRRTHKWLLIEDFLNFQLCGRMVTDYSMASCTALFDQRTLSWSDELVARSGIRRGLLCEAQPSGTRLGEVHAEAARVTGVPAGTPVVLGGHDHLCGGLPVGAFRPGFLLNVMGTWETIMTPTTGPVLQDALRLAGMTVQAHVAAGLHTIWGGNVSGDMLHWWASRLTAPGAAAAPDGGEVDWSGLMEEAAAAPPGARGLFFLPHMAGSACPVVDPQSLGAVVGLHPRAGRGDLARSVIEGLNYQFLSMVSAIEAALQTNLEQVVAVGGAARNELWMQSKADLIGRPVTVAGVEEATPLGAAMLAGIGVEVYEELEQAYDRVRRPGRTYHPDASRSRHYARGFDIYQQLHAAVAPLNHRIFQEFLT